MGQISGGSGSRSLHNLGASERISRSRGSCSASPGHSYGAGPGGLVYRGVLLGLEEDVALGGFKRSLSTHTSWCPLTWRLTPTCRVRQEEKDQIKALNNKFASFIDKVRHAPRHPAWHNCHYLQSGIRTALNFIILLLNP